QLLQLCSICVERFSVVMIQGFVDKCQQLRFLLFAVNMLQEQIQVDLIQQLFRFRDLFRLSHRFHEVSIRIIVFHSSSPRMLFISIHESARKKQEFFENYNEIEKIIFSKNNYCVFSIFYYNNVCKVNLGGKYSWVRRINIPSLIQFAAIRTRCCRIWTATGS